MIGLFARLCVEELYARGTLQGASAHENTPPRWLQRARRSSPSATPAAAPALVCATPTPAFPPCLLALPPSRPPGRAASEEELRYALGLTNMTTGKGKVDLKDSNIRPMEIFMCSVVRGSLA